MFNQKLSGQVEVVRAHDKIIHFYYGDGATQHKAMGRAQAIYDAPVDKFQQGYFSRQDFEEWTKNFGLWASPWVGTNKPVQAIYDLAKFPDLSPEEQFVVDQVKAQNMPEGSYLISSSEWNGALRHEMCHALWYCFEDYRTAALAIMNAKKHKKEMIDRFKHLTAMGYKDSSLLDEANAYMAGSGSYGAMADQLNDLMDDCLTKSGIDFRALECLGQDQQAFVLNDDDEPELTDDEWDAKWEQELPLLQIPETKKG